MIGQSRLHHLLGTNMPTGRRRFFTGVGQIATLLVLVYLFTSVLPACRTRPTYHYISSARLEMIDQEPTVRIRIIQNTSLVRLDGPHRIRFRSLDRHTTPVHEWAFATPVQVSRAQGTFVIQSADGQSMTWAVSRIMVKGDYRSTLRVEGVTYPQQIALDAINNQAGKTDYFDVVNYVTMERYLPGVVASELYRDWPFSTFKAQAIAARSYAIVQCAENWQRHFDLESTTANQVYRGVTDHTPARKAVQQTKGQVLTYQGMIVPAYYSSCCGGWGQDATVAFPDAPGIRPLWGEKHSMWCTISPHFRWGPVVRSRGDLAKRLATWGQSNHHPVANLRGLTAIAMTHRHHTNRPEEFILTDTTQQDFKMRPETFRIACNHQDPSMAKMAKTLLLKSSYLDIDIEGDKVQFTGHGFGHGVGMCQWGACGMAKRGHDTKTILAFYYPSAVVQKIY